MKASDNRRAGRETVQARRRDLEVACMPGNAIMSTAELAAMVEQITTRERERAARIVETATDRRPTRLAALIRGAE